MFCVIAAVTSLNNINRLIFVMGTSCVLFEVGTGYLKYYLDEFMPLQSLTIPTFSSLSLFFFVHSGFRGLL